MRKLAKFRAKRKWIKQRMMRQETHNELTDYWKKHNFNSKLSLIQTNI
jgi:hypothetical protein